MCIKYPTSREARHFHIESYVESQANVVQLEAELQRRRRAEIRSLVPLDTVSTSDEVIVQLPEPAEDAGQQEEKKKKKRRKWYQFRNPFKKPREGQETVTTATTTTTTTTAHIIPQRNSWAAPDPSSYQHYQTEKLEIMHEGLCGLNNVNIIRALGGDRPTTTSMVLLPSQQQQELKRDSGVSFASQKSRRKRFSVRLGALREDDQEQQQQPPSPSTLIGVRYPRMIHRQTLRDAAIHVLSSDLSVWDNDDMDEEYPRNKRFSDPGLVFSP
ncbi:hypothetical protein BJV82DRAFT_611798 [Fennellomyces sp. T-0311]|nr:hypothetical protein BJV82DRAFT_611798 [Fennellomyces sp. T-0311]